MASAWRAYAASQDYPVGFYTQPKGSPNVVSSSQFLADAKAGKLPALVMRIPKNRDAAARPAGARVPRLDDDAGLADLVDPTRTPTPPPTTNPVPVGDIILRDGHARAS